MFTNFVEVAFFVDPATCNSWLDRLDADGIDTHLVRVSDGARVLVPEDKARAAQAICPEAGKHQSKEKCPKCGTGPVESRGRRLEIRMISYSVGRRIAHFRIAHHCLACMHSWRT